MVATSEASGDANAEATGGNSFVPSLELAIESAFASADTKSLDRDVRCQNVCQAKCEYSM